MTVGKGQIDRIVSGLRWLTTSKSGDLTHCCLRLQSESTKQNLVRA